MDATPSNQKSTNLKTEFCDLRNDISKSYDILKNAEFTLSNVSFNESMNKQVAAVMTMNPPDLSVFNAATNDEINARVLASAKSVESYPEIIQFKQIMDDVRNEFSKIDATFNRFTELKERINGEIEMVDSRIKTIQTIVQNKK